ncbi:hypothetical protein ACQVTW_02815 [Bacillus mycoides]|uniref:hypothetical protein n=1 Tax=Bacillus TaxID=1386 RepID=UPI0004DD0C9A|nr:MULTISPECIES: hypothetical protein [Bacillus]MBJ7956348.1 hypothetical protein [Bacillus cereus group sp. N28]MBJ8014564.1 hypothetical protein [Bacillus cereus group sp. N34]MBK5507171.1 hypothetical protein [Bacillus sp. TH12]HDR7597690.1 hypothetical protein [Bacillus mycoides]
MYKIIVTYESREAQDILYLHIVERTEFLLINLLLLVEKNTIDTFLSYMVNLSYIFQTIYPIGI